jgi:hypothetical protein
MISNSVIRGNKFPFYFKSIFNHSHSSESSDNESTISHTVNIFIPNVEISQIPNTD